MQANLQKMLLILVAMIIVSTYTQAQYISPGLSVATSSSVTLNYTTAVPTSTIVQWGLTIGFGNAATSETSGVPLTTKHSVTINGLQASTPYRYRIIATDVFGEVAIGNYQIFTTAALQAHAVSLSWQDVMSGLTFNVYRSSVSGGPYIKLAATPAFTYVDSSVITGQTYYYITTAQNTTGAESSNSNEAKVTIN